MLKAMALLIILLLPSSLEDSYIIRDSEPIILVENGTIYVKHDGIRDY